MSHSISRVGTFALMVAHCAGMVDLVALPVWVGVLVQDFKLDTQQAGGIVTLFLMGVVVASIAIALIKRDINNRLVATLGCAVSAAAFFGMSLTRDMTAIAALHFVAGLAAGAALSVTHGTIGRAPNPHRLFAVVGMGFGVFAIIFMGVAAPLASQLGGAALFRLLGGVMAFAAVVAVLGFPGSMALADRVPRSAAPIPATALYGVAGISVMALVQAMTFSFMERVGHARGFSVEQITGVLIAIGVVNLFPAALAALLERRIDPRVVLLGGPIVQAAIAATIMSSGVFPAYAGAASLLAAVMIFTHTFAFGLIGRLDPSGRLVAATPAMLMTGAAIGPILGGTLIKFYGFTAIAGAAGLLACVAVVCFSRVRSQARPVTAPLEQRA